MKEAYCSFETSKLLKKKGFDEECTHYYTDELIEYTNGVYSRNSKNCDRCTSPTHQMACAWLRENYDIFIQVRRDNQYYEGYAVEPVTEHDKKRGHKPEYFAIVLDALSVTKTYTRSESYEDAVDAAIKYCLENLI